MAEPAAARLSENGTRQSVGELVSLAIADLTRLIQCEIALAKSELRGDIRRMALSAALISMALFAGFLVFVMLCFALAYGLVTVGVPAWAAFLCVAATCFVLALVACGIVWLKMRRISGLRRTRASVHDSLALLRRDEEPATPAITGTG